MFNLIWLLLSCVAVLDFSRGDSIHYISLYGRRLKGKALSSDHATFVKCMEDCAKEEKCGGIHLIKPSREDFNDESSEGKCTLFAMKDITGYVEDLQARTYYVIKGNTFTCDIEPCVNKATCRNLSSVPKGYWKGYKCDCPCGWCGDKCERLHYGQGTLDRDCVFNTDLGQKFLPNESDCLYYCTIIEGCRAVHYDSLKKSCFFTPYFGDAELTATCASNKEANDVPIMYLKCDCDN